LLIALANVSHGASLCNYREEGPHPTDKHVGARVRMRRKVAAMSQRQLADALGITYQQLHRNEKGLNLIGSSRLQQITHILQVPVAFFFEASTLGCERSALLMAQLDDFVSGSEGLRLMEAFRRIDNAALRRRIMRLVRDLAG
jgi:transcriptional regulator with XRE-family HTH domain